MNERTAEHLNHLLARTVVISFDSRTCGIQSDAQWDNQDAKEIPGELSQRVNEIIASYYPAAMAQEISTAATERRLAKCFNPMEAGEGKRDISWWIPNDNQAGRIAVDMATPQINALIATDNARRTAEYERYRIACEQGVAVPPANAE